MHKSVNLNHLQEYQKIFSSVKMHRLWSEYLKVSQDVWDEMPSKNHEQLRLAFHSWKSNSQVFGMDEFSTLCAEIEEQLLKHKPVEVLQERIAACRKCYERSILVVNEYFEKDN